MKNKGIIIAIFSLFLLAGCSQGKVGPMDADWDSENFEELGFSEEAAFGTKIEMVNNKKKVVTNYLEVIDADGALEGSLISDSVTGEIYEYTLGESGLFYLVSKANLNTEIIENNPVYYAGLATLIVTDDEGNLYHLVDSEEQAAERITQEELDRIFQEKDMKFGE